MEAFIDRIGYVLETAQNPPPVCSFPNHGNRQTDEYKPPAEVYILRFSIVTLHLSRLKTPASWGLPEFLQTLLIFLDHQRIRSGHIKRKTLPVGFVAYQLAGHPQITRQLIPLAVRVVTTLTFCACSKVKIVQHICRK